MDRIHGFGLDGRIEDALDVLYDAVDNALWFGDKAQSWPDVEALLMDPRWEKIDLELLVGALIATFPVRGQLGDARPRIIRCIKATDSIEARDERVLVGLEEP
jgi:hypothetical protein